MEKNIIINNEFVKAYVSLHTTIKTAEEKMKALREGLACGTYVYQGKEAITSSVTIAEVSKKIVKAGYETEYNAIMEQIKALQEQADALTERVYSHNMVKVTKAPKGLNK